MISRIKSWLLGGKPTGSPYDGILHKVAGPSGHALAFAERSAIARALQQIGYANPDPSAMKQKVDEYTEMARRLHAARPEHPLIKHYTDAASKLNAPDVHATETGFKTVPTTGPAGEELARHAVPLVRFLNRIRAEMGTDTVINPQKRESIPAETVARPTIASAMDAPAEEPEYHKPVIAGIPTPVSSDTHKPIPLVGEPAASRWRDLDALHAAGKGRADLLAHIMNVHGANRRQASDTLRRWVNAKKAKPLAEKPMKEGSNQHDEKRKWISEKIGKIMSEGIRGKKVDQKQAAAVAYSMWREKMARPKPGEAIKAKHLDGEAFRQPEITAAPAGKVKAKPIKPEDIDFDMDAMQPAGTGLTKREGYVPKERYEYPSHAGESNPPPAYRVQNKSYPVDPQIAGTALAYHLRQIAQASKPETAALAEYALAGRTLPGVNGDVYRALGKRLKKEKHPLADAYNWENITEKQSVDNWLERFIRKHVQHGPLEEHHYFDLVKRQFGNGKGKNNAYNAFWSRLQKAAREDNVVLSKKHHEDFQQTIEDALHRIADRHQDRAYLREGGNVDVLGARPRGALKYSRKT